MLKTKRPIADWMWFSIADDHMTAGIGAAARDIYFFRLFPRNMSILSRDEKLQEHRKLQTILDSCGDSPEGMPSLFVMDKTENLDELKGYYESLLAQHPEYEFINREILRHLIGMEEESACVERAFYFILRVRDVARMDLFAEQLKGQIAFHIAQREEIVTLLRNYLLREFTPYEPMEFDKLVDLKYTGLMERQARKKRPKPVDKTGIRDAETLRMLLPNRMAFNTRYCEQNDFLRKTIAIRNYPAQFETEGILRKLATMAGVTVKMYFQSLSSAQMNQLIDRQINNARAKRSGNKFSEQQQAATDETFLTAAYRRMLETNERMYYTTVLIELYAPDIKRMNEKSEKVKSELLAYGITKDDLIYEQQDAFLSVLPFGVNRTEHLARNMPTSTIAATYPLESAKKVDMEGFPLGRTSAGGAVIFNPFQKTATETNSNILIVGAPGQGKSWLVKKIISSLAARGTAMYTLDPEDEYVDLYEGLGGANVDCGLGGFIINVLEVRCMVRKGDEERDRTQPESFRAGSQLAQHLSWLRDFFTLLYGDISSAGLNILMILVQKHYNHCGIDDNHDPEGAPPEGYPTLGTLYKYIDEVYRDFDKHTEELNMIRKDDLRDLLLVMRDSYDGSLAQILNGHTNLPTNKLVNFQLRTLMQGATSRTNAVLFNIMTWVWARVVTYRQPLALTIDELYMMMDRKNPVMAFYLRNFAKRSRKYDASIIMATQNLADFDDPELTHVTSPLFQIPAHKFIFYPGDIDKAVTRKLLNLNDGEMALISESHKQWCLMKSGNDKYHLKVGTMDYEAELFGKGGGT